MLLGDIFQLAVLLALPGRERVSYSQSKQKTLDTGKFSTIFSFFQLIFAPLLGQYTLNCAAPMFFNSVKLLRDP